MNEGISENPLYKEIMKNRCLTCYKGEKGLVPLTEKRFLEMFVPEITLTHGDRVCGDCDSMLKKMMKFRITVLTAQQLMKAAYKQNCQDVEQKITDKNISKEEEGNCSTVSCEQHPYYPILYEEVEIKEEFIDTDRLSVDIEHYSTVSCEQHSSGPILHEEVEIKEEFVDTDRLSVDMGHCSTVSCEQYPSGPILHEEVEIKEEFVDTDQLSVDIEHSSTVSCEQHPSSPILHEKVEIIEEFFDTDRLPVDLEEVFEDPISVPNHNSNTALAFPISGVIKDESMEVNRVPSNSLKINTNNVPPPLRHTNNQREMQKENGRYFYENMITDDCIPNDGDAVLYEDVHAFTVKVMSDSEFQEYGDELKAHHIAWKLKCERCIFFFKTQGSYDRHMKTHVLSTGDHTCSVCQQRFLNNTDMIKHRKKHFIKYICAKCDYNILDLELALKHYKCKHFVWKRACKVCKAEFDTYRQLRAHRARAHAPELKCDLCGVMIRNKFTMKLHMARHMNGVPRVECSICKKKVSNLSAHMAYLHEDNPDGMMYCQPCHQTFRNKRIYQTHLKKCKRHNPESIKLKCETCGKLLGSKIALKYHMETIHTDVANYPCDKCDQKFKNMTGLKVHIRTKHANVARARNAVCEQCGKAFHTKKTLEEHMTVHTGERPHSCADCGATFGFKGALFTHRRLRHKVKRKKDLDKPAGLPIENES